MVRLLHGDGVTGVGVHRHVGVLGHSRILGLAGLVLHPFHLGQVPHPQAHAFGVHVDDAHGGDLRPLLHKGGDVGGTLVGVADVVVEQQTEVAGAVGEGDRADGVAFLHDRLDRAAHLGQQASVIRVVHIADVQLGGFDRIKFATQRFNADAAQFGIALILVPGAGDLHLLANPEGAVGGGHGIDVDAAGRILDVDGVIESVRLDIAGGYRAFYRKHLACRVICADIGNLADRLLLEQAGEEVLQDGLVGITGVAVVYASAVGDLKVGQEHCTRHVYPAFAHGLGSQGNYITFLNHSSLRIVGTACRASFWFSAVPLPLGTLGALIGVDGVAVGRSAYQRHAILAQAHGAARVSAVALSLLDPLKQFRERLHVETVHVHPVSLGCTAVVTGVIIQHLVVIQTQGGTHGFQDGVDLLGGTIGCAIVIILIVRQAAEDHGAAILRVVGNHVDEFLAECTLRCSFWQIVLTVIF